MEQIKQRFAYQFSGKRNLGFSIPKGWIPSFKQLCADVDNLLGSDKHGFYWIQLKEKFGSARYYWNLGSSDTYVDFGPAASVRIRKRNSDELRDKLRLLISSVQDKTTDQCAVCGNHGVSDSTGGWLLVLCKDHIIQRKAGQKLDLYDEE